MEEARNIERGPYITDEPMDMLVFEGTPSTYIECKAKGNPNPSFDWRRDNDSDVTSSSNSRYAG